MSEASGTNDRDRRGREADPDTMLACDDCMSPQDAFSVVASETRLQILEALWRSEDRPVRFSELRREVGMKDSAQFNYHLGKLTDQFVTRTDEGYDLKHAGKAVVSAVLAGTFNEQPDLEPFDVGDDCVACGGPLRASYADETLSIDCPDCGKAHGQYGFPPGGLTDRDETELLRAFDQRVRHLHCLAADGVCPECNGRMETRLVDDAGDVLGLDVRVDHVCSQCRHRLHSSIGLSLLDQSPVVTVYRNHGIDLARTPYWTLPWCVSDEYTEVVSRDPWRVRVRIPVADEALVVTVGGDLGIREVETRTAD
ncbi:winged helix-turn-helix domain-containing protein [Haloparvum sp. AD34]